MKRYNPEDYYDWEWVRTLRNDNTQGGPVDYDWYEHAHGGWSEGGHSYTDSGWEEVHPFGAMNPQQLLDLLTDYGGGDDLVRAYAERHDDPDFDLDDWLDETRYEACEVCGTGEWSPMMNYYYPLDGLDMSPEEAQVAVMGTSCVVALVDGEPVLALAGGGMDLTWDIVTAYVKLGLLPPLHFCSPPRFAGDELTDERRQALDACRRSIEISQAWTESYLNDLNRVQEWVEGGGK